MIGKKLNQRYKITALLGEGAMGEVYKSDDEKTGQQVAVKILARQLIRNPDSLERFRREAETLRQLKHPNIVAFVDAFEHNGQFVIVMEYVPGGSLHELIKQGPLPIEHARQIALDLCDALIRAHRLNIIHRDIKPENVLIAEDGTPKLADFGVARLSEGTRMTRSGTQVGTPYYMSPEAWEGKALDAQADIWSLGIMLFEMLAGQVPFGGDTGAAVMNKVLTTQPPDLSRLRTETPTGLIRIVRHMLIRDKKRRYQTMREVAVDLERKSASQLQTAKGPANRKTKQFFVPAVVALVLLAIGSFALFGKTGKIFARGDLAAPTSAVSNSTQPSPLAQPVKQTAAPVDIQPTSTPICVSGSSVSADTLTKAEAFSKPILASLAGVTPTFQDDFSTSGNGWTENRVPGAWQTGTMKIADGVLRFSDLTGQNLVDTGNWSQAKNFVFQIDQRLVEGYKSTEQRITFHLYPAGANNWNQFSLQTYQKAGFWTFRKSTTASVDDIAEGHCGLSAVGTSDRITLVVKSDEFALLVNDQPMYYVQDPDLAEPGFMHLSCFSPGAAVCEWDNVEFWNLEKLK